MPEDTQTNVINLSTAGIKLGYAVEVTAGTRPTTGYKALIGMKSIPELNPSPETIDVTTLDATEYKEYIEGLKDLGGALGFTANFTQVFYDQWKALMTAYTTAKASGKAMWFTVYIPGISDAVFFKGTPANLGVPAAEVGNVLETTAYITPTNAPEFFTAVLPA